MTTLKSNLQEKPLITIITVVYNAVETLEKTIVSVINQSYEDIEYIIIDGGSTDGSTEIAKKYESRISTFISERDQGIYDAMNKGVNASTGDWLLFLNADDYLVNETVIEKSIPYLNKCSNLIAYGNIIYMYPDGSEVLYGKDWAQLKHRFRNVAMCLAHQATFHSKKLFAERLFNVSFKIAGDYDFLLNHLKDNDATYFPITISKMKTGGLSYSVSKFELLADTRKAQINNGIYKLIPSLSWITSAIKLIMVDTVIKIVGIRGKNMIKRALNK